MVNIKLTPKQCTEIYYLLEANSYDDVYKKLMPKFENNE